MSAYFDGDRTKITAAHEAAAAWEMLARAYMELLASPGRNEPDDRIFSIEVAIADSVPLKDNLLAVVVPDSLWEPPNRSPLLEMLAADGAVVVPYRFNPGRPPEHYHDQVEAAVREFYRSMGIAI